METKIHSVKYNFIMNFILTASSFIFPLITFPYATRVLGVDYYGNVSFGQSVMSYFILISSLGIPSYGIRACAKVRDDKKKLSQTTKELFYLSLIATVVVYVCFFLSLGIIPKFAQNRELLIINCLSIILNTIGVQWLFSAIEQYTYITVRNISFKVITVLMMVAFVHSPDDYLIYALVCVLGASASNILNYFYMWKFVDFKQTTKCNFKPHLKPVFIFFASSAAVNVYTSLDSVMLGFLTTDREVGLYTASIRLKGVLVGLVNSLSTVLLPRMSYYVQNEMRDEYSRMLSKSFNFIMDLALPLVIFFVIFGKESLILISGTQYADATLSMQIIIPTLLFIGLSTTISNQVLIPHNRESNVCVAVWASAIVDFVLNLFLIPLLGAAGASLATLLAEIVNLVVQFVFAKELVIDSFKRISYIKILIPSIIAVVLSLGMTQFSLSNIFIDFIFKFILFFIVYGLSLLLIKEPLAKEIVDSYLVKLHLK